MEIPLRSNGGDVKHVAHVDPEDFDRVAAYRWHAVASRSNTYARRWERDERGAERYVWMHREILGLGDRDGTNEVDHLDGDGLNNRRANLIPSDRRRNAQNRRKIAPATSRYRGVFWHKSMGKWCAHVKVDGKRHYLGFYVDEEDANRAAIAGRARFLPHSQT
jgi:hypothetical protein